MLVWRASEPEVCHPDRPFRCASVFVVPLRASLVGRSCLLGKNHCLDIPPLLSIVGLSPIAGNIPRLAEVYTHLPIGVEVIPIYLTGSVFGALLPTSGGLSFCYCRGLIIPLPVFSLYWMSLPSPVRRADFQRLRCPTRRRLTILPSLPSEAVILSKGRTGILMPIFTTAHGRLTGYAEAVRLISPD
jgi:hypothetical protein